MFDRLRSLLGLKRRSYDGAGGGRRWRGQPDMPASLSAMHAARGPLARRARYLAANNALAASAVEAWVSALVGTGIKPQSAHADPDTRAALNLAWEAATDDMDADGLTDGYGLQAIMVRRMVVDGEAFALLITDAAGFRIRLIDAEQVDPSLNRDLPEGGRIVQGIEFDAAGRRVAYHVLPERPGMPFAALPLNATRVPAENMVHLFRPETPGQVRGISWFAPVILRLADLDQWRDAQLVRQKVAAMLAGFVTSVDGSGQPFEGEQHGAALVGGLEPGTLKFLDPGQDVRFSKMPMILAQHVENLSVELFDPGVGAPVAFYRARTINHAGHLFAGARLGLAELFQRPGVQVVAVIECGTVELLETRPAPDAPILVQGAHRHRQAVDDGEVGRCLIRAIAHLGVKGRRKMHLSRGRTSLRNFSGHVFLVVNSDGWPFDLVLGGTHRDHPINVCGDNEIDICYLVIRAGAVQLNPDLAPCTVEVHACGG